MAGKKDHVNSQIRIPESIHNELKNIATESGSSLNSTMLMLLHLGMRIYKDSIILHPENTKKHQ